MWYIGRKTRWNQKQLSFLPNALISMHERLPGAQIISREQEIRVDRIEQNGIAEVPMFPFP
jgi:hypothetical protein